MKKFQNKYRIPSARLENWDYGANGAYFITICTDKMQHYFGEIFEREMQLNELGKLAHDLWQEITNQFPYVELGNFVIMPNHMHGILIINKSASVMTRLNDNKTVETRFIASPPENADPNSQLNNNDVAPQLSNNENAKTRIMDNETVETRFIASPPENADPNSQLNNNDVDPQLSNNENAKTRIMDNETAKTRFIASPPENADPNPQLNNNDIDPRLIDNEIVGTQIMDNETVQTRLIASVLDPRLIDHEIRICKGGIAGDKNPMLNENISRIIRWYKGRCSFEMRKIHADFKWHSRFHDHIIRNSKSFDTIQTYIENNPSKWGEDKFHK
ncbi:transposase [Flavobacterium sp. MDT1-60]|uniref:transposase n=1 Tax=Flavobacterium sp. MDT1-60 TaxID=1979344 RepID=UPI0017858A62|nr:transposase [Flavobacterium sp. MDT1-60]QOG01346.1 hypothetical protein IHE43_16220 [Flavobacterium sp. MDT1-60]